MAPTRFLRIGAIVVFLIIVVAWLVSASLWDSTSRALAGAIYRGDATAVSKLLAKGADPNYAYYPDKPYLGSYQPLHVAARVRDEAIMGLLLKAGADPNGADNSGRTPLFYVLFYSADAPQEPCIRVLVKHGADVNAKNKDGLPALDVSIGDLRAETVKLLLDSGADVNGHGAYGRTPLHQLFYSTTASDLVPVARLLLSAGADINAKQSNGKSLEDIAKANEKLREYRELISSDVPPRK
jgi:ankyrin repeat protein